MTTAQTVNRGGSRRIAMGSAVLPLEARRDQAEMHSRRVCAVPEPS